MDCRKARMLLSPYLDGVVTGDENTALVQHLSNCANCSSELDMYKRLSLNIREVGQEELQAPPDLCGIIMNEIKTEKRQVIRWLPVAWRKTVAAAAAMLLLAGGSAGVAAGLKIAGNGKMVALDPFKTIMGDSSETVKPNSDGTPQVKPDLSRQPVVEDNVNPVDNPEVIDDANPLEPHADDTTDNSDTVEDSDKENDAAPVNIVSNPSNRTPALLSKGIIITSTELKLAVDELSEGRAKAVAMAAGANAVTKVFPEQNAGKSIVVLRITVESELASNLIAGLGSLGTVLDRKDDSRDKTNFYNQTLIQYHDVQSRIGSDKDAAEIQQLKAQASAYKQQLDELKTEAGKRVIMLWLESK